MDQEQWSKSLIFPVLSAFACVMLLGKGQGSVDAFFLITVGVVCGIVPLLLTLIFKLDTSKAVTHKLKYSFVCLIGILFIRPDLDNNIIVLCVFFIFDFLYLNTYDLPLLNRLVAALSNPTLVLLSFMAELMEDLSAPLNLGF